MDDNPLKHTNIKPIDIKLLVVFSFTLVFIGGLPLAAQAAGASLYFSPSSGVYTTGEDFSVSVKVNSGEQAINAVEGNLFFDINALEIKSVSKSGTILTMWTQEPVFSNASGTMSFGGGIPNPGFTGSSGTIVTVTFRAKITGSGTVNFTSGAILANDGKGTNILASMVGGTYTLQPKVVMPPAEKPKAEEKLKPKEEAASPGAPPSAAIIASSSHPDENKWYKNNNPEFSWNLPADIMGVSFKFDKNPNSIPGNVSDGLFKAKSFKNIEDGIWYFHLKFKNKTGWGSVSSYKIQIDTTSPNPFEIIILDGEKTTNPNPILNFKTEDKTSGIEYYEVKIGEGDIFPIEIEELEHNPFQMSLQASGKHTIIVKAIDRAGNQTISMKALEILSIESPKITEYPRIIEKGQPFTIQGTSLPKCLIGVYYQGEEVIKLLTKSNSSGFWEYVFTKSLKEGVYYFWAEATDERGATSQPSEKITIKVQPPVFLRIGEIAINYLSTIITILILCALIIFGGIFSWQKTRKYRASLKKETKEAEESLHKAIGALREDIGEKLKNLQKIKTERALTEEEKKIEKELKENLDIAEKYVAKEIKDIEDKIR